MGNLTPASNIIFGFIGGLITAVLLQLAKNVGYDVPASIVSQLPWAIGAACAHLWDVVTGDNKK